MTVDELVVTLNLDASNFTDEQKKALEAFNKSQDAIDRRLKGLEERNKKSAQSFGDATHAAEGLFTVLAGAGLVAFSRDIVNTAAGAGRMATNIGIATNELSAFGRMIERNGGNAEAAAGSMKGLTDAMQRAKWGEVSSSFLTGLSQVGGAIEDSPLAIFFKLAKFAESHSAQEVNQTAQRLGLSQEIANVAIKGGARAMEEYRKASEGALSPDQARKLTEMQEAWVKLDQTIRTTGTDVVSSFAPGFIAGADAVTKFTAANRGFVASIAAIVTALAGLKGIAWVLRLLGLGAVAGAAGTAATVGGLGYAALHPTTANEGEKNIYENGKLTEYGRKLIEADGAGAPPAAAPAPFAAPGAFTSKPEKEAYIRAQALAKGIDPDIAMSVAKSEGFNTFIGDQGSSFGAFQLHYGGIAPGGNSVPGLGDEFTKRTGLDARDPANEKASIVFALDYVRQHGWGDFHGAANSGIGRWQGIGTKGGDVNIGTVNINTDSKDPKEHGRLVVSEIEKVRASNDQSARSIAMQANSGQRQ